MVTHDEKQRLLRDFHREPVWSLGVVLKCVACLLILISVAVVGTRTDTQWETRGGARTESGPSQQQASAVESKNGFDADRARLEEQSMTPQSQAAR